MEFLNKYNELIQKITLYFSVAIALSLPFYNFFTSYVIIGFGVFTLLQLNFRKRFISNFTRDKSFLFWSQLFFYFLLIIAIFWSNNNEKSIHICVRRLSIILFPIFFSLSATSFEDKKLMFLKLFVAGTFIAAVLLLLLAAYKSFNFADGKLEFAYYSIQGKASYFNYTYFSRFRHPAYFSMYLNFSVLILFYFIRHNICQKKKLFFYLLLVFFVVVIFLLSSKAGLFTIIAILFWNLLRYLSARRNILLKISILLLFFVLTFLILQNKRFEKMYNQVEQSVELGKQSKNYPERFILWENSIEIIQENFWIGTTPADAQSEIHENLLEYENVLSPKVLGYNSHNQYLQTFVESGIVGFLVFLFIFGGGLFVAYKRKQGLFLGFMLIVILNFFFESMINMFAGLVFIFYFYNYFVFVYREK